MKFRQLVAQEVPFSASCTVVFVHSPKVPENQPLRDLLPFLAVERPAAFAAFQSTHRESKAGKTLQRAEHVACLTRLPDTWMLPFLPDRPSADESRKCGWYLFAGIYEKERVHTRPSEEVFADPWIIALQKGFGAKTISDEQQDATGKETKVYQFSRTKLMSSVAGRLVISANSSPTYARLLGEFDGQAHDALNAYEHYLEVLGGREAVERRVGSILKRLRG